jgi:hypothetical protein
MTHSKKRRHPQPIGKRLAPLMIFLIFTFSFFSFILANAEYKIISFKGKVKIKNNTEVIQLEKQLPFKLKKGDAVMVYPGAAIEMSFTNGNKKTFTGPFYSAVEALEKPFERNRLSFFGKPGQWKAIERIFDEEGEESAGTTKGTQEDSLNFYSEINQGVAVVKIEDKSLTPDKEKEMNEILETAEQGFNAFPEEKQIVIRALVYKTFGRYKTALTTIFSHYKGILYAKGKQPERELMEDYLFSEFLPIVVTIHSPFSFSSNFKLWWAAFFFDGTELKGIEKTIDYSLYPQNDYKIKDNSTIQANIKSKGMIKGKSQCVFIVACADWAELEKFDDIEIARQELLESSIKETKLKTIQDYGKVIIKLCL